MKQLYSKIEKAICNAIEILHDEYVEAVTILIKRNEKT